MILAIRNKLILIIMPSLYSKKNKKLGEKSVGRKRNFREQLAQIRNQFNFPNAQLNLKKKTLKSKPKKSAQKRANRRKTRRKNQKAFASLNCNAAKSGKANRVRQMKNRKACAKRNRRTEMELSKLLFANQMQILSERLYKSQKYLIHRIFKSSHINAAICKNQRRPAQKFFAKRNKQIEAEPSNFGEWSIKEIQSQFSLSWNSEFAGSRREISFNGENPSLFS